jgi:uncharacterized repeat protein (TIGR01451 family)
MRSLRLALLLLAVTPAAFAQDFAVELAHGGTATTGGDVVYGVVVSARESTVGEPSFVVRVSVPEGLTPALVCDDGHPLRFDAAKRELTWEGRLDNPGFAQKSCPVWFRVGPPLEPGSSFTIAATLSGVNGDTNASNDTASHTNVVHSSSDLEVTASADQTRFRPGTVVTHTLSVTNHGPQDAYDVLVTDKFSSKVRFISFEQVSGPTANINPRPHPSTPECEWPVCGPFTEARLPVLHNGETAVFRMVVESKSSVEAADLVNRVTAHTDSSLDLVERNNTADVWTFVGPAADLSAASRVTPSRDASKVPVLFTFTNDGPDVVNHVTMTGSLYDEMADWEFVDAVQFESLVPSQGTCAAPTLEGGPIITPPMPPSWVVTCDLGSIAPGGTVTVEALVRRAARFGPFQVTAVVTPRQNDPTQTNNLTAVRISPDAVRRRTVRK